MRRMEIVGVRVEMPHEAPMLLLREQCEDGSLGRYLPIWIASGEATAISQALEGLTPPRPFTHDLLTSILAELHTPVKQVTITEIVDGTFFATLQIGEHELDCRPSDAIALALRNSAPVLCTDQVLGEAGVNVTDTSEDQVEAFRVFLDQVTAEDFSQGSSES